MRAPRRQEGGDVEWIFLLSSFGAPFVAALALMSEVQNVNGIFSSLTRDDGWVLSPETRRLLRRSCSFKDGLQQ